MITRRLASLSLCLFALPITLALDGCSSLNSIAILPAAGSVTLTAVGQTAQYTAVGSSRMGSGPSTTSDITNSVSWTVRNPAVATISASGLATAVGAGKTDINAQSGGFIATSDITVTTVGTSPGSSPTPTIAIVPSAITDTFIGETTQFTASGNLTGVGSAQNLTNQVQWISSNVQIATVTSGGLATALAAGTTTIVAQSGGLNASATLTVAVNAPPAPTLTIIPSASATATFQGETTQFIAIGNLSGSGVAQNLTNNVVWNSSDVALATIDQNGLATGNSAASGVTTITAIGTTTTGSVITATSTLNVVFAGGTVTLPTLTVYEIGSGTGNVASGTLPVSCGPSSTGTLCTGSFPKLTTVTLTATPILGSTFGGWSTTCKPLIPGPSDPVTGMQLKCTVYMDNNQTVGAIFNK